MKVSSGSSGLAPRKWFDKAPRRAATTISKRFGDVAPSLSLRFSSGFCSVPPRVLSPLPEDAEFYDFVILFDTRHWTSLDVASDSAVSQILGAIIAFGVLSGRDLSDSRDRCIDIGIKAAHVTVEERGDSERLASFHSNATRLLPNAFFWDDVDEHSPFGNDTGADVLYFFRRWRFENPNGNRLTFFEELLAALVIARPQLQPSTILGETQDDSLDAICAWDDAIISWAFAQIACDGNLDSSVAESALAAAQRQLDSDIIEHRGWTKPEERIAAIGRTIDSIQSAPKVK